MRELFEYRYVEWPLCASRLGSRAVRCDVVLRLFMSRKYVIEVYVRKRTSFGKHARSRTSPRLSLSPHRTLRTSSLVCFRPCSCSCPSDRRGTAAVTDRAALCLLQSTRSLLGPLHPSTHRAHLRRSTFPTTTSAAWTASLRASSHHAPALMRALAAASEAAALAAAG